VLGETCSGKSTLVESLFGETFEDADQNAGHGHPSVRISSKRKIIEEGSVKVNVSVTVCSGLGDQLDKGQSASPAVDYIEALFAEGKEHFGVGDANAVFGQKLTAACQEVCKQAKNVEKA
jgi:septin family protein